MTRKVLFIINPNAGKKRSSEIVRLIRQSFSENYPYEISVWEDKDNFNPVKEKLFSGGFTVAVAVGGDGTVNQVAKTIVNTEIALGIIPVGSGNGLARTLGVSMKAEEAIKQIESGRAYKIDSGEINGIPFFCTSGLGFDARIGQLFASSKKRGLSSYTKIVLKELFNYKSQKYIFAMNGEIFVRKAFLVTVANAGQYGNDFYIAPEAKVNDGIFHVAILKPFSFFSVFGVFFKIIRKKAHESKYIETFTTRNLKITRVEKASVHFDGEPKMLEEEINFSIFPDSLNIVS
ncbi:MAG: diacylglycerol kinase family lipid kinase [Bacteroidia bacterium]|nr:diacylglycerol kinase family lipid kinase [Bacteroidia bacterium]